MKRALLFAGQGQQFHLMGQDLANEYPSVAHIYKRAHEITGIDILHLDEDSINQTKYTQLAVYVIEMAILTLIEDVSVDVVAGLSLGEYAALTKAGVIDFDTALKLIQARAEIMDSAFEHGQTGMMALLKTDIDTVEKALINTNLEVCNYNTASQIVIGGWTEDLEAVKSDLKEAGFRMMIPLKVSSVSHMSLLSSASEKLRVLLDQVDFKKPTIPFIANVSADYQVDNFQESLQEQICKRTRIYETLLRMIDSGVEEFVEIGPKGSIGKFVKSIDKELKTVTLFDLESVQSYLEMES